jgi:hypothetical protein
MTRVERYRQHAENARKRAQELSAKGHGALDQIPAGQPIITGRGSRTTADINRRERAHNQLVKAVEETERADYWEHRADKRARYDQRLDQAVETGAKAEGVIVGDTVTAHFTNSGHYHQFRGVVVGRTVNDWKVRCQENFRTDSKGELYGEVGRVFKIAAFPSRTFSANNRVYKLERTPEAIEQDFREYMGKDA